MNLIHILSLHHILFTFITITLHKSQLIIPQMLMNKATLIAKPKNSTIHLK